MTRPRIADMELSNVARFTVELYGVSPFGEGLFPSGWPVRGAAEIWADRRWIPDRRMVLRRPRRGSQTIVATAAPSHRTHAAINWKRMAGDVAGFVRQEPDDGI